MSEAETRPNLHSGPISWEGSPREIAAHCEEIGRRDRRAQKWGPVLLVGGFLGGSCQFIVGMGLHSVWLVLTGIAIGVWVFRRGIRVIADDVDERKISIVKDLVAGLADQVVPRSNVVVTLRFKDDYRYDLGEAWADVQLHMVGGDMVGIQAFSAAKRTDIVGFQTGRVESVAVRITRQDAEPAAEAPGPRAPEVPKFKAGPLVLKHIYVEQGAVTFMLRAKQIFELRWGRAKNPLPDGVLMRARDVLESVAEARRYAAHLAELRDGAGDEEPRDQPTAVSAAPGEAAPK